MQSSTSSFNSSDDRKVHRRVPQVQHELKTKTARIVALPAGPVDAVFDLDNAVIDVNFLPLFVISALNSGRKHAVLIPARSFAYFPRGTFSRIRCDNHAPRCILEIDGKIDEKYFGSLRNDQRLFNFQNTYVVDDSVSIAGMAAINYLKQKHESDELSVRRTVESFILSVISRAVEKFRPISDDCRRISRPARRDRRMMLILVALRDIHYKISDANLRVQDLADKVSMDHSSFQHQFFREVAMSPEQYIARTRKLRAQALIDGGELSLETVVEQTGFENVDAMLRAMED